jgi:hypothetical protein
MLLIFSSCCDAFFFSSIQEMTITTHPLFPSWIHLTTARDFPQLEEERREKGTIAHSEVPVRMAEEREEVLVVEAA